MMVVDDVELGQTNDVDEVDLEDAVVSTAVAETTKVRVHTFSDVTSAEATTVRHQSAHRLDATTKDKQEPGATGSQQPEPRVRREKYILLPNVDGEDDPVSPLSTATSGGAGSRLYATAAKVYPRYGKRRRYHGSYQSVPTLDINNKSTTSPTRDDELIEKDDNNCNAFDSSMLSPYHRRIFAENNNGGCDLTASMTSSISTARKTLSRSRESVTPASPVSSDRPMTSSVPSFLSPPVRGRLWRKNASENRREDREKSPGERTWEEGERDGGDYSLNCYEQESSNVSLNTVCRSVERQRRNPDDTGDPTEKRLLMDGSFVEEDYVADGNLKRGGADSETIDVVKSRKQKCANCCKSFLAFLFSTVGLTCLMVGYVILGGFIFGRLESANEEEMNKQMRKIRKDHIQLLWNLTEDMNILHPLNWSIVAEEILKSYTAAVYNFTKKQGWDGKDQDHDGKNHNPDSQWSFAGSLLYSITVVTTIGYGHIAPKTNAGRVVTMLYAIVGIPLTLLTITNLGSFMATAFRFIYKNILCGLCCICCMSGRRRRPAQRGASGAIRGRGMSKTRRGVTTKLKLMQEIQSGMSGGGGSKERRGGRSGAGAGEAALNSNNGTAGRVGETSDDNSLSPGRGGSKPGSRGGSVRQRQQLNKTPRSTSRSRLSYRERLRLIFATDDIKDVTVPIYVSLLLITGYIALGALLFSTWEEDWNYLIGCYFCFITLSTIGFGDFVPGTSMEKWDSQAKLILCSLYLLIGLALIAMCFDLMQEQARASFRALGRKLGLIND